jgi:valyl-tRNA synthetase
MTDSAKSADRLPERPTLEGLEAKWSQRWQEEGTYTFDRSKDRVGVYAIDTPPPTVSGALHIGSVFSFTHTDFVARFQRMRGKAVYYPMGWDDNGLPTERRVQNYFGVRCDPALPYDPALVVSPGGGDAPVPISRRNFIELCERLTAADERAFEHLWRLIGLSVDWAYSYTTIGSLSRAVSQKVFLRNLARGEAYQALAPTLWDVSFSTAVAQAELEDRQRPGALHRVRFAGPDGPVEIETTRPELLPACVALVCHPSDPRYAELVGRTVQTPLFHVDIPVYAHPLAQPDKGTGIAMVCTFGDLMDVTWWRELRLDTRAIVGRDGRLLPSAPAGLAGLTVAQARTRVVAMLATSGDLLGELRPITHPVKFYEKGDLPLEIVTSRQWYIVNGGRDLGVREELVKLGRQLRWVPEHMRHRYEHWVNGLTGDWLISRQRFFGVPFPVWYRLDESGTPDYTDPLTPAEARLPIDPASEVPDGYTEDQRGRPGGFVADPDVMDTWATSSLTPLIVSGWERDADLFGRVYPMDLRPQGHEIIRTWLFSSVVRARTELGGLPWHTAQINGWILDPDRKKMSKSFSAASTPVDQVRHYGADAVRYWAANGRSGVDIAFDENQMRIGRRLATKLQNASRFVLGLGAELGAAVSSPVDRSMLGTLSTVVSEATSALESYDHTGAIEAVERFFWAFCDDYIELVKERAYGSGPASDSARTALALALSVQLRLFAPIMPYVTEEIWSWRRPVPPGSGRLTADSASLRPLAASGSIHRAPWPTADELAASAGDPAVLSVVSQALHQVRRAKSDRRLSMKAEVSLAEVLGPAAALERLAAAAADLRAAGRIGTLDLRPGHTDDLTVACAF